MPVSSAKPNDVLLLEARLQQRKVETHPDASEDDYFLVSSIDTVLRSRSLSYKQIEDGMVEGANDGGIDAVYTFQNGILVEDEDAASGDVDSPLIELEIIQAKNESGFKEVVLQKLIDHLPLLLHLDPDPGLTTEFNPKVLDRFTIFRSTILRAANRFPQLVIRVRYATKSADPPHEKVDKKSNRLVLRIREAFPDAQAEVDFVGAPALNARARERLTTVLELRMAEGPITADKGGLVCLVTLADYFGFIADDDGRLRDEVFEENVRGYEGATVINRAIGETLRQGDEAYADFWWLNNGITLLGRRVQTSGKRLVIDDPQVVNGLQTSRNIHQYFVSEGRRLPAATGPLEGSGRHLLVRVIEAPDDSVSAQIIKATNSQNRISVATLRATEPFQRKLEEHLGSRACTTNERRINTRIRESRAVKLWRFWNWPKPWLPSSSASLTPLAGSRRL